MLLSNTPSQPHQQNQSTSTTTTQTKCQQQENHQQQHSQQDIRIFQNNNNNYYFNHNDKQNLNYSPNKLTQQLPTSTTATATGTTTDAAVAAAAAAATLLFKQTGAFALTATAAERAAAAAQAASATATTTNILNSNSCVSATDFSIAAIMARGANASSREPSERSLSPVSVERYPDPDDDVDVDVVDCSDSESQSARPMRGHHRHQLQQQQQSQTHHKLQRHHHHNQIHLNHSTSSNTNGSTSLGAGGQQHSSRSCSRGRASPHSPSSPTANDEDRLSPEPPQSAPKIVGSCNCDELLPVQCHLETKELWDKFHELGTEMIITKTGRGAVVNVPISVVETVTALPRRFEDTHVVQVLLKRRLEYNHSFITETIRPSKVIAALQCLMTTELYRLHNIQASGGWLADVRNHESVPFIADPADEHIVRDLQTRHEVNVGIELIGEDEINPGGQETLLDNELIENLH
ncbi:box A-binding factor-like [Rhagoletis pomonella]|uniref:box A-binding factor-like n=1 Tax=Rhagoletis pomonella TaxID=28610 RepID=UPI00177CB946|nr:box A-binding factor-like [Rhagoletis pomonella]